MAGGFRWVENDQVTSWPILKHAWRDLAQKLEIPVMILWSGNDADLEPSVGAALANAVRARQRRVEHIVYPSFHDNGHLLFDLLEETVPNIARVAVVYNPLNPISEPAVVAIEAAAKALKIGIQRLVVRAPGDLDAVSIGTNGV